MPKLGESDPNMSVLILQKLNLTGQEQVGKLCQIPLYTASISYTALALKVLGEM